MKQMDIEVASKQTGQIVIMSGERRVAVAIPKGANFDFCAEALPDAAAAFGAASSASAARPGTQAGFKDSTAMGLLQTFNRTENAELLRTWGFLSCLAKAQGYLQDPEYRALFSSVTAGLVEVMKTNAASTRQILATGSNVTIVPVPQTVATQIPPRKAKTPGGDQQPKSNEQPATNDQPSPE